MASVFESIMVEVTDRMKVAGSAWPSAANIRRAHKTAVPRDDANPNKVEVGLHVIDGFDRPADDGGNEECGQRECGFTLALFVRSAAGPAAADPMKVEVMRRMNPTTAAWPEGVSVYAEGITLDDEIADVEAIRIDMEFSARYATAGEWNL